MVGVGIEGGTADRHRTCLTSSVGRVFGLEIAAIDDVRADRMAVAVTLGGTRLLRGGAFGGRWRGIGGLRGLRGTATWQGRFEMLSERRCHGFPDIGRLPVS